MGLTWERKPVEIQCMDWRVWGKLAPEVPWCHPMVRDGHFYVLDNVTSDQDHPAARPCSDFMLTKPRRASLDKCA